MTTELEKLSERIARARGPEDLFGPLHGSMDDQLVALRRAFHALCRTAHPDANGSSPTATDAIRRLTEMRDRAAGAVRAGTYGKTPSATLHTRRHTYAVLESMEPIGIADAFRCLVDDATPGLLTIARTPADNDLLRAEAGTLR
ncbi:MAG TPA: hypothetical protein VN421_02480, partial [Pseudoflavonifractor sp.]|nr:hypothetical protein [Pseudoflavonifractor sp.]